MSAQRRLQHVHHARRANMQPSRPGTGFGAIRPMILATARLLIPSLASAAPLTLLENGPLHISKEEDGATDSGSLVIYLIVAVVLVLLGGVFAGLTIAFMGQDETYLQVIASSGEGSERKHATKVLNLLKKGKHWVLVTLLLSNVITNETLPIVLDRSLGGGWPAVVSSTVLIVIFGEIAPQSVCVRYGLSIGAFMAPSVLALMWLMFPVAWPVAKLLDWILGEDHGTTYKKAGLKTLVHLHKTLGANTERLLEDEVNIISSVLDLKEKPVGSIITPMQDVFTMSADTVLDEKMMDTILSQGYSRIPIHTPDNYRNFIGMLLVKILITYDPEDCKRVRDFTLATLPETAPDTSCLDIINFFQEGKSHMVLVSDFPGDDKGALGVVTLEDVIEELIGEEIIDESDVFIDVHKAIRRLAPAPGTRFGRGVAEAIYSSDAEAEGKEATEDQPLLGGANHADGSKRPSIPKGQTTFLMRRKSSNASDLVKDSSHSPHAVHVRSGTADMREHLKHLGPSNMASKPRATKYTSVKIKPGVGTIPENQATTTGTESSPAASRSQEPTEPRRLDAETSSLLKGDGASDGVAALRTGGYGTLSSSPVTRSTPPSDQNNKMSASEASQMARENTPTSPQVRAEHDNDVADNDKKDTQSATNSRNGSASDGAGLLKAPEKLIVTGNGSTVSPFANTSDDEKDAVGELSTSNTGSRRKSRHVARSGSITQTTVDSGGLKKMVLETTSSSSEPDDSTSKSLSPRASALADGADDESEVASGNGQGQDDGKKKRKKRGKRKKGGA